MATAVPDAKRFRLIAAAFTPLHPGGKVDLARIPRQHQWLRDHWVNGVVLTDNYGEGLSMTAEERKAVVETWLVDAERIRSELEIIVHVGHAALPVTMELAAHAEYHGADGVVAYPPFYVKADAIDQVVRWCQYIAGAAPKLRFYYHHIPSFSGVTFRMEELLPIAVESIPSFAGVVFSSEDLSELNLAVQKMAPQSSDDDELEFLFGKEEMLLGALPYGVQGAVGPSFGLIPNTYRRLIESFQYARLNDAARLQAIGAEFVKLCQDFGGLRALKAATRLLGERYDCGAPRLPVNKLEDTELMMFGEAVEYMEGLVMG